MLTSLKTCVSKFASRTLNLLLLSTGIDLLNSPIGLFSHLENLIARLDLTNLEFFLLGDMNADMASTNYDNNVHQLINIADIYGLHQLICEPTRITDKSSTLIDLIYTNCPERVVCSGVAHISISDHSLVYAFRKLSINF